MSVPWFLLWLATVAWVDRTWWGSAGFRLEAEEELRRAREGIVETVGIPTCSTDDDCSSMPAGKAGCGGPSFYVVFARDSVDLDELEQRVRDYTLRERRYNERFVRMYDCIAVSQPQVACDDGVCVARR